jgi:hypothetical protein
MSDQEAEMALALCAYCSGVMRHDYGCRGCDKSIHWFCSDGGAEENEINGHGAHYWCVLLG